MKHLPLRECGYALDQHAVDPLPEFAIGLYPGKDSKPSSAIMVVEARKGPQGPARARKGPAQTAKLTT
jgi:hypothetical protein